MSLMMCLDWISVMFISCCSAVSSEATSWDNYGAFVRLAEEVVLKHGIVFVASAGNNGPAM